MFFKGARLEDTHGTLRSQGENTQAALRLEFTGEDQIVKSVVASYAKQAIAVDKAPHAGSSSPPPYVVSCVFRPVAGPHRLRPMLGSYVKSPVCTD